MNGKILASNINIFIEDIGILAPNQLVCTSDLIPCCRTPTKQGDWYFPDGRKVIHTSHGAVAFHRNRDDDGNVNLFRVSNTVLSPTGRFCCETKNSTENNQTICVNVCELKSLTLAVDIILLLLLYLVYVSIDNGGVTPLAEENYTLTCRVNKVTVTAYQWRKDGQTHNERGQSLLFSPLTLSHAGQYTCAVRVDSRFYNSSTTVAIKSMFCLLTIMHL